MSNTKNHLPNVTELKKIAKEKNLTLRISRDLVQEIRNAHFKEGLSINKIKELYQKALLDIGVLYKTQAGTISKRFVPSGQNFVRILLGYSTWEDYKKKAKILFLNSKEKLSKEIGHIDLTKEKNILVLLKKLNLTIKFTMDIINEIRKKHYEEGSSMIKIARELESDLKELDWFKPNEYRIYKKQHKTPVFRVGISKFLFHILGYSSWEDYQKNQRKLYLKIQNKKRRDTGFTQKKKIEIRNSHQNKCMICNTEKNLNVHHLDNNPENNEDRNLKTLCKKCHIKVGKGYYKYNIENDRFEDKVFYHIFRCDNKIQIKSFYDKKLLKIIKSLYPRYRSYNTTDKYWLIELKAFQFIKTELFEYIKSTKKKYEIKGDINFERNDELSQLRKIQKYKCYECGEKLYDIDSNVPIKKWSQKCSNCYKETTMVTYILTDEELDDCVIGSDIEIDLILQLEYSFVDRIYKDTMKTSKIGNICIHCGNYLGSGDIEDDFIWNDYKDDYEEEDFEKHFPVERILSSGNLILKIDSKSKDISNLALVCFDCFSSIKEDRKFKQKL